MKEESIDGSVAAGKDQVEGFRVLVTTYPLKDMS